MKSNAILSLSLPVNLAGLELQADENAFASVDTEAEFDAALAAGRSIQLGGGTIDLHSVKHITANRTTIQGPGHLRFVGMPVVPDGVRCLCIEAEDVVLQDFELSSGDDLATICPSGINFPGNVEPHRATLRRLDIHHWHSCVDKWGSVDTPWTDDITIEDCYLHQFQGWGMLLSCGVRRAKVRRCRVLGKQQGESHAQLAANAFYSYGRIEDLLLEDCTFGGVLGMGIEINAFLPDGVNIRPKVIRCRVVGVGYMGLSIGHCIQGYVENVIVDGAKGIGIEIGGDENIGRCEGTALVACDVRDITNHATLGYVAAYSIDGTNDTILLGCRAANVSSSPANISNGVYVVDSDRAAILNCAFMDVGATAVLLWHGPDSLNSGGNHLVQGCTFRHTFNLPGGSDWVQRSVFVSDINAVVRLNTTFKLSGGDMRYSAQCNTGAVVHCDAGAPVGWADFTGSNNLIPVPA